MAGGVQERSGTVKYTWDMFVHASPASIGWGRARRRSHLRRASLHEHEFDIPVPSPCAGGHTRLREPPVLGPEEVWAIRRNPDVRAGPVDAEWKCARQRRGLSG
jgi:hypothetical protein